MYTTFRFAHSPNPRRTCSSLWGLLPAAVHCSSEETQAQGAPAYGFSSFILWSFPIFIKPCLVQRAPTSRPSILSPQEEISRREVRKNPIFQRSPGSNHCVRRAEVTFKCLLIFLPTICNIIKSFPNHTRYLTNTKIKKGRTKVTLPEVVCSEGEKCSLMSPLKRKNYVWKRNNHCSHLLTLFV